MYNGGKLRLKEERALISYKKGNTGVSIRMFSCLSDKEYDEWVIREGLEWHPRSDKRKKIKSEYIKRETQVAYERNQLGETMKSIAKSLHTCHKYLKRNIEKEGLEVIRRVKDKYKILAKEYDGEMCIRDFCKEKGMKKPKLIREFNKMGIKYIEKPIAKKPTAKQKRDIIKAKNIREMKRKIKGRSHLKGSLKSIGDFFGISSSDARGVLEDFGITWGSFKMGEKKKVHDKSNYKDKQNNKNDSTTTSRTLEEYIKKLIGNKKNSSRRRGEKINIDEKYLTDLRNIQGGVCPYSGEKMIYNYENTYYKFASNLDRVDTTLGYIKGNVCFCTRALNLSKNGLTLNEIEKYRPKLHSNINKLGNLLLDNGMECLWI